MASKKTRRRSKRQRDFIQTILFFLTTFISIAGLIIYLWVYTEIDESLITIHVQNKVANELIASINELKMEISSLERVDRLTTVARNELGMVVAKPETLIVYLDHHIMDDYFD